MWCRWTPNQSQKDPGNIDSNIEKDVFDNDGKYRLQMTKLRTSMSAIAYPELTTNLSYTSVGVLSSLNMRV